MAGRHRVVIVGGGPVGVGLAVDLALRGVPSVVIERRRDMHAIPKGQNLSQRTLEHFHSWGIAEALRAARVMPPGSPIGEITAYGSLASDYWYAPAGRETVRPFFFQDNERLPQYRLEEVLRGRMAGLAGIEARFGWTATALTQDQGGARVSVSSDEGTEEVLEADYVVGCDGGHSLVREQIGIARAGTDFDQLMVLAVFRSRELHDKLKRFPERSTYRVMHPDLKGYWLFFGRVDVGEEWFFHAPVPVGTDRKDFDFRGLIQKAAGFEFAAEYDHVGFWDLRVAIAERYRVGRVFIAGDAAHSHPPYGAFGLNTGLEDAVNLSWKLAAVLEGWGSQALLDSYGAERRPVFKETAEGFIAAQIDSEREFLDRYNPDRDRAEFERVWFSRETVVPWARGYEPHYEGSPVVHGLPGGASGARGTLTLKAKAGHHLAPRPLSTGRDVFEELGRGFTLIALGAGEDAVAGFEAAAGALNVPLKVIRDSFAGGREAYEAPLVLVRPDQFVAWAGDGAPGDIAEVVGKAVGRA